MALTIGELVAYLDTNNDGFHRGLQSADREMDTFSSRVGQRLSAIKEGFSQSLGGLAGLARVAAVDAAASLVGPLGAAAGTVVAAFASAGAAVGAFGLAIGPQTKAIGGVVALWDKLAATTPGTKQASAAAKAYADQLAKLPPATRATATAFIGLRGDFKAWSDALAPKTMPVLTKGIGILRALLPTLTPLVNAAADALSGFMDEIAGSVKGGGVAAFTKRLADAARKTLPGFLRSLKNVAVGLGGVLGAFLPFSTGLGGGLEKLTKKFADFGQGLQHNVAFQKFMADTSAKGPALLSTLSNLAKTVINVTQALAPWTGATLLITAALARFVAAIPQKAMDILAPAIASVVVGMKAWAVIQGVLNVVLAANPIGIVVIAIAALVAGVILAYKNSETFRRVVDTTWAAVKKTISEAWNGPIKKALTEMRDFLTGPAAQALRDVSAALDGIGQKALDAGNKIGGLNLGLGGTKSSGEGVLNWVRANWAPSIGFLMAGPLGFAVGAIAQNWSKITGLFSGGGTLVSKIWNRIWDDLVSSVQRFGPSVLRAVSFLMHALFNALLSPWPGIRAQWNQGLNIMINAVVSWAAKVVNYLRGVPGRMKSAIGNLGGLLVNAGASLMNGLIRGIDQRTGGLIRKLGDITKKLPDWKGPPAKDRKILYRTGQMIMGGLTTGMTSSLSKVRSTAKWATAQISGAWANASIKPPAAAKPKPQDPTPTRRFAPWWRGAADTNFGPGRAGFSWASARQEILAAVTAPAKAKPAPATTGGWAKEQITGWVKEALPAQRVQIGFDHALGDDFTTALSKNIRVTAGTGPDSVQRALGGG